ncbi:MAG: ribonuclease HII [Ignavibacteriaceae bacterium]|nr:ribonuclease HII [Ignavibacteriaceae bacterium]
MKNFDSEYRISENIKLIAGVDEAGRGPLAGPVVAASVILPIDCDIVGINDSKKLKAKERNALFAEIISKSICYSYCIVHHNVIDKINILQATLLAMKNSISKLSVKPELILVDGNKLFNSEIKAISIVKGDSKSESIAAASILAKVIRDDYMEELSYEYPKYLWATNKGYPTKNHIMAIKKFGLTPYHRKSFLRKIYPEVANELFQ